MKKQTNQMTEIEIIRMLTAQLERASFLISEFIDNSRYNKLVEKALQEEIRFNEAVYLAKEKIKESRQ